MTDQLQSLSNSSYVSNPFAGLNTEYLQQKYFVNHFNLVVSNPLFPHYDCLLSVFVYRNLLRSSWSGMLKQS